MGPTRHWLWIYLTAPCLEDVSLGDPPNEIYLWRHKGIPDQGSVLRAIREEIVFLGAGGATVRSPSPCWERLSFAERTSSWPERAQPAAVGRHRGRGKRV